MLIFVMNTQISTVNQELRAGYYVCTMQRA